MSECTEFQDAAISVEQRGSPRRVVFGTALLSTASITKLALQCVLIPVLARLLGPGIFGEMSIAMSFVLLANMLSDGGMGAALIREHEPDQLLESTVWWLSAAIGIALALIICVLAWPISLLYGQHGLLPVLLALSPILVMSSSLSVANARIVRAQRFDVFAAGDVGSAVAGAAAGLAFAFAGFGVWSLVFQQLVFWATKTVWVTFVAGFRPAFAMRLKSARPLWRFSANNLAAAVADFASKNAPVLIVGGLLGVAPVARFAMSYQLTRVAETVVSDPVNLATFAGVAAAESRRETTEFVLVAFRVLLLVLLPLFCGLALTADLVAPVVLGHRWDGTGPALAALAPGALLLCLYRFATAVLLGKGHAGRMFKLTLLTGVATSLGTYLAVRQGVTAAIVGFSTGAAVLAPLYLRSLARPLHIGLFQLLASARTSVIATAVMAGIVFAIRANVTTLTSGAQLMVVVAGGALTYAAAAIVVGAREILDDIEKLRSQPQRDRAKKPEPWPFMPSTLDDKPHPLETIS